MSEKQSYRQNFKISSYDLNPGGYARLTSMANYFQEIAYRHASQLGFGYHDLEASGTFWVLSRMRIKVDRYPLWDEVIEVETWPNGIDKIFAIREFRVKDEDLHTIAVASTAWLVVDIKTRRPLRVTDVFHRFKESVEPVFDRNMEKIALPDSMKTSQIIRVNQSDLDVVGHVNNVKYIEWSLNHLAGYSRNSRLVNEIEINYMLESLLDDEIEIRQGSNHDGETCFSGVRTHDGKEIYRARIRSGG